MATSRKFDFVFQTYRWTYDAELDFNLNSYAKQKGVFEVATDCKIPPATDGALTSALSCTGTLPSDCDPYAQGLAYSIAAGEKFGAIFLHMDEATAQGHIAYAFFWSILGTIFTWLGLILLLYSEIKAVTIVSSPSQKANKSTILQSKMPSFEADTVRMRSSASATSASA